LFSTLIDCVAEPEDMLGWLWDALWALLEALGIVSKVPPVEEEGTRVTVKAVSGQSISLLLKPDWTILDVKQHLSQQLQAWATLFFSESKLNESYNFFQFTAENEYYGCRRSQMS
jgi:hypothetical protein